MADQAVAEQVQEMFDKLLGDKAQAEAFSEDPEGWLTTNGYDGLPADAVAECGVQYGSGATAVASSGGGGYAPGVAGVAQAVAPSVYNTYIEDNSITNNLAANGDINLDQNVIQGDDNVLADDGGVAAGGDIEDSQIQTGSGIQAGEDVDISDSAVNTGAGGVAVDDSTIDDSNINTGDAGGDINQAADIDNSQVAQGDQNVQVDVDDGIDPV